MKSFKQAIRTVSFVFVSCLLAIGYPLSIAVADDAPTTTETTTAAPSPDSSSTSTSTAPDSSTTTTPATTTEPAPTSTTAAEPTSLSSTPTTATPTTTTAPTAPKKTYTYDSSTGRWNSDAWTYNTGSGTYVPTVVPQPPATTSTTTPTLAQTGLTNSTANAIGNALASSATSGDASILSNTAGGNATTGDATSVATVLNNVNSTLTNTNNTQAANFVSNVMGDVNGDIMLQPMLLKAMLEAAAQSTATNSTVNSTTNTNATNNIDLNATSGNATVAGNTSAGNATSGDANTVANVINLINSMVAANQSFVGTINIYGNLNGDILIAPDFIPQLLASNGASNTPAVAGSASITSNDNQSVVNNIVLAAQTGQALVTDNTAAGSATTGNAATNTVIFNLTNHAIVASNSLLVFVNVLGRWVGVIVDAPTGATAAAIGNGVVSDTVAPNLVIDATNNTALTNNINLTSQSGDATITKNTLAGNATTGNATASANVANITGSQMGLSGWFGVLFINVFGSWLGSFGINTDAGNPIVKQTQAPATSTSAAPEVIKFIPHSVRQAPATIIQGGTVMTTPPTEATTTDTDVTPQAKDESTSATPTYGAAPVDALNLPMLLGSLVLVGGSLFGLRRLA